MLFRWILCFKKLKTCASFVILNSCCYLYKLHIFLGIRFFFWEGGRGRLEAGHCEADYIYSAGEMCSSSAWQEHNSFLHTKRQIQGLSTSVCGHTVHYRLHGVTSMLSLLRWCIMNTLSKFKDLQDLVLYIHRISHFSKVIDLF